MATSNEKPLLAPYTLQPLVSDVLLVSEESDAKVEITCVEAWRKYRVSLALFNPLQCLK